MNGNPLVTMAILLCMLSLIAGFAVFLYWLIRLSKRYGEKVSAARIAKTAPNPLILKSSPVLFSIALFTCGIFTGGFFLWRFILGKVDWQAFEPTVPFMLAVTALSVILFAELFSPLCAVAGFFTRRLYLDGDRSQYTNWLGRTTSFRLCDITAYQVFRIRSFLLRGKYLSFVDESGKKRFAVMYLSDYSCAQLARCLEHYVK